jgi:hypothetical protein
MLVHGFKGKKFWGYQHLSCGPAASAPPSFSLTFESGTSSGTSNLTTLDYGTLTYGAGGTRIIVAVGWSANAISAISGITIGGTALAQVSGAYFNGGAFGVNFDIWETTGPLAGSSGDVQITYTAAPNSGLGSGVALYNLVTSTPTAFATNAPSGGFSTNFNPTINVPTGGVGIVVAGNNSASTYTFTSAAQDVVEGANVFAHTTAVGSPVTVGITASNSGVWGASAASWGP